MRAALVVVVVFIWSSASAAPPEPSGPHPRIILDGKLKAAWKAQAKEARGPVPGSIALCRNARDTHEHDRAVYQGSEWSRVLQGCLVAWAATDDPAHATTAIKFFKALLDDLEQIGDGQGGDQSASRDSGYAIRNLGPYTALAYDWLHNAPGMTPALRQHARERWAAWLTWYRAKGYRARHPGTNYQAGYLAAATLIAIAQGSEAAEQDGPRLWRFVADELWGKDMAAALSTNGILDGGDWPEGWQYGPLAVAHYALAARAARAHGIKVDGIEPWLSSLLRRHVYGLSPNDRVYAGQDTEDEQPNLAPHVLTLNAIALGDAPAQDKKWALGELVRLKMADKDYYLYDALANVGEKPELVPRDRWPTWYLASATGTLFARTRWDAQAMWFVAECQHALDVDHRHPKAGNFVLSRGADNVIVDPSPYGSQSSLTSNAPTVASGQLPRHYIPSQADWSVGTGWKWTTQTKSGVIAARCDYADQFKFQGRKSDVPEAQRDFVFLPSKDGTDASVVIVDRASTRATDRPMFLRFRSPAALAMGKDSASATATVGASKLTVATVAKSAGTPTIARPTQKDCFKEGTVRGRCDAARFAVADYRIEIAGPDPRAVHVVSATATNASPAAASISGDGWSGVRVTGARDAVVVWPKQPSDKLSYRALPGTHVILDAPERDGSATIKATRDGQSCAVEVTAGGTTPARPAIFVLDASCALAAETPAANAATATAIGTKPPPMPATNAKSARSGCCGAQSTPGSPLAMSLVVIAIVLRRKGQMPPGKLRRLTTRNRDPRPQRS
ncbi:MAG: hypothetical protein AB7P03_13735 [Kofleriaceae bacterium]